MGWNHQPAYINYILFTYLHYIYNYVMNICWQTFIHFGEGIELKWGCLSLRILRCLAHFLRVNVQLVCWKTANFCDVLIRPFVTGRTHLVPTRLMFVFFWRGASVWSFREDGFVNGSSKTPSHPSLRKRSFAFEMFLVTTIFHDIQIPFQQVGIDWSLKSSGGFGNYLQYDNTCTTWQ